MKVFEERERLEDENEKNEEENDGNDIISDDEIDKRCDELRSRLLKELEEAEEAKENAANNGRRFGRPSRDARSRSPNPNGGRKQFKAYQVHELAEAKIEESERLRKALGIKDDFEKELDEGFQYDGRRGRERERS